VGVQGGRQRDVGEVARAGGLAALDHCARQQAGEDLDHDRPGGRIEGPDGEAGSGEAVQGLHPVERAAADLAGADELEHRLGLHAGRADVELGAAERLAVSERRVVRGRGPGRRLGAVHPGGEAGVLHRRRQGLVGERGPELARRPPVLAQVPGRQREREVEPDDEIGVAVGRGDEQVDELGPRPAALEAHERPRMPCPATGRGAGRARAAPTSRWRRTRDETVIPRRRRTG